MTRLGRPLYVVYADPFAHSYAFCRCMITAILSTRPMSLDSPRTKLLCPHVGGTHLIDGALFRRRLVRMAAGESRAWSWVASERMGDKILFGFFFCMYRGGCLENDVEIGRRCRCRCLSSLCWTRMIDARSTKAHKGKPMARHSCL